MHLGSGAAMESEPASDGKTLTRGSNGVSNGSGVDSGGAFDQNQGSKRSGKEALGEVLFTLSVKWKDCTELV